MKIEIHIRESKANGRHVGKHSAYVESCRVYKEAGDGLRLDNAAKPIMAFFLANAKAAAKAWRTSNTPMDFAENIARLYPEEHPMNNPETLDMA